MFQIIFVKIIKQPTIKIKTRRKPISSAVYTAIEARHKSLDYIANQAPHRAFEHFSKGGLSTEWWDEFWHNYGLMEAESAGIACQVKKWKR
jgi:hypothetical protein